MAETYQQSYYQRVLKPKREAERAAKLAKQGKQRFKRGPARRQSTDILELHIKFSGELRLFVEERCATQDYQAFIEQLVENEYLQSAKK